MSSNFLFKIQTSKELPKDLVMIPNQRQDFLSIQVSGNCKEKHLNLVRDL